MRQIPAGPSLSHEDQEKPMNGPKQHRPGTDCALCTAHSKAAQRHTALPRARTQLHPPCIALSALRAALLPFSPAAVRWLVLGLVFGLGAGAARSCGSALAHLL